MEVAMTHRFLTLIAVLLPLLFLSGPALAQKDGKLDVRDIKANPATYLNEVVTVEGEVAQYENDETTTAFYTLKGRYGNTISVRTDQSKPKPFEAYIVTGVLSEGYVPGMADNTLYISETSRTKVGGPPPPPPPRETDWLIYIFGGLIVLLIGAIVAVSVRKRNGSGGETIKLENGGKTIKTEEVTISYPPPGTLKVLPGRLIVKEGLTGIPELRFYKQSGQVETEITFGRESGQPYRHIQLKSPTVSGKQAKLVFNNGQYTLINYAPASSNPTTVNGKPMGVNSAVTLHHGDVITMGEVTLEYSAS